MSSHLRHNSTAFASYQVSEEETENNREIFEYTSGRWMYVEFLLFGSPGDGLISHSVATMSLAT